MSVKEHIFLVKGDYDQFLIEDLVTIVNTSERFILSWNR
jgi:hypothetical protein